MAEVKAAAQAVQAPEPQKHGEAVEAGPVETDPKFIGYLSQLDSLRANGENKIIAYREEIRDVKLNKQIDKETKDKIIEADQAGIVKAREVQKTNKPAVQEAVKQAVSEAKEAQNPYIAQITQEQNVLIAAAKEEYKQRLVVLKNEHATRLKEISASPRSTPDEKKEYSIKLKAEGVYFKSLKAEASAGRNEKIDSAKTIKYNAYLELYGYEGKIRNARHSVDEQAVFKYKTYGYNFNFKTWLLKNALYLIILAFYIVCIAASGGKLVQWNNIVGILSQSSSKMFYALGVAGLILIAGTDLSIGRMTGMGASVVCMVLCIAGSDYTSTHGVWISTTAWPLAVRVVFAIFLSILLCTIFSVIAGFFSAKFKMHPFITTLSTQLIMFAMMEIEYIQYPAFNMDLSIKKSLAGDSNWNLIIMAGIAIVIMWFIWNKTKFGKNMYAVGGNAEAASVSGISVFWTTLFIFIMAGVMYGLGGFVEAVRGGQGNPNTGYGTELDAIAACVVGGISFNGGVGTIGGAVFGTIIFTGMTYCLTALNIDVNYQYLFKGVIIMAAVCLDSIKYLKKK